LQARPRLRCYQVGGADDRTLPVQRVVGLRKEARGEWCGAGLRLPTEVTVATATKREA
jgi:hypothetical protein